MWWSGNAGRWASARFSAESEKLYLKNHTNGYITTVISLLGHDIHYLSRPGEDKVIRLAEDLGLSNVPEGKNVELAAFWSDGGDKIWSIYGGVT